MSEHQQVSFQQKGSNTLLSIENQAATAEISLYGGHVISYVPKADNKERLWMSELTQTDGSEAIRGGVPVCWPWFGTLYPSNDQPLPRHGYARTATWQLQSISQPSQELTVITLILPLYDLPGFPYQAQLEYRISVGAKLNLSLTTVNLSDSNLPVTGALHSYFRVDNINDCELLGINGPYEDKVDDIHHESSPTLYKITAHTDRIHLTNAANITLREQHNNTFISMQGHDSIVVWNPWQEGSQQIANMVDSAYQEFVCVEAAITTATDISPEESLTLQQEIY